MELRSISLVNFRNLRALKLFPATRLNVIFGANASGKTNLCEAIYYAAKGLLLKGDRQRDLITWGCDLLVLSFETEKDRLRIYLNGSDHSKSIEINAEKKRQSDLYEYLRVLIFTSEDLQIIKGSPGQRRRFLDRSLCDLKPDLRHLLLEYDQLVQRKNALLRTGRFDRDLLDVFNQELIEKGAQILAARFEHLQKLNECLKEAYAQLTNEKKALQLRYEVDKLQTCQLANLQTCKLIQAALAESLEQVAREEERRGFSLVGPHRDDLAIELDGLNVRRFGSQGEQKSCMIALKLAQLELQKLVFHEYPILIMDDVLSELDASRIELLLNHLPDAVQIFLTHTELTDALRKRASKIFFINNGSLAGHDESQGTRASF